MTPTLFTAESASRLYVSASIGNSAIYATSPLLVTHLDGADTFKFGGTNDLERAGKRKMSLALQTRVALVMRQMGEMCVWLCASEIGVGDSAGTMLVSASIRPAMDTGDHPPTPDPSWKILAMQNGVVFTPDLT